MTVLKIAIPKGRSKAAITLLNNANITIPIDIEESRKYVIASDDDRYQFIIVKPVDVPIVVEYGAADIGIVGKDILIEEKRNIIELYDLKTSVSRISVIGSSWKSITENNSLKVATRYPNLVSEFFRELGKQVEIIKLSGSLELSPLIGLSDCIVDLIESEKLPREYPLFELFKICDVTDRIISNRVSYQVKRELIESICP